MDTARIIIGDSRCMRELADASVDLVVTSPPYWHLKDYRTAGQIGHGQSLHEYLRDMLRVWNECFRVLRPGRRLCINIGDQFARATLYGRYKVIPLHAEAIAQGETAGFDYLGSIIWRKRTTLNPSGGAVVMGSYPFPPNGIVEIDFEYILILRKPGKSPMVDPKQKEGSRLSREEWKEYFSGHWSIGGGRKVSHEAIFPPEIPRRLIRMFSFAGETVLDPFLGSGTTLRIAMDLGRQAIGYEINRAFIDDLLAGWSAAPDLFRSIEVSEQDRFTLAPLDYTPRIPDAAPPQPPDPPVPPRHRLYRVAGIEEQDGPALRLDGGPPVRFLGLQVRDRAGTLAYLRERVLGRRVFLRPEAADGERPAAAGPLAAYVYLKNRIFINAHLLKAGLAAPDPAVDHRLRRRFFELAGSPAPEDRQAPEDRPGRRPER